MSENAEYRRADWQEQHGAVRPEPLVLHTLCRDGWSQQQMREHIAIGLDDKWSFDTTRQTHHSYEPGALIDTNSGGSCLFTNTTSPTRGMTSRHDLNGVGVH